MKDDAEQRIKTNLTLSLSIKKILKQMMKISIKIRKMSKQFNISVEDIKIL